MSEQHEPAVARFCWLSLTRGVAGGCGCGWLLVALVLEVRLRAVPI